ncbi:MAG: phytanoyl-CoA dioxygenase family protein [Methanoregulaceae archaeon]|nr:phytanoyl-CoA dioxygenase family protein [Methanoregulaceae archaeon]
MHGPELTDFFAENGYAVVPGVFMEEELEDLQRDFDRIVAQLVASGEEINARWTGTEMAEYAETVVLHTHNVQQYSAVWMRALLNDRLLDAAEAILGPDIVLHHTKLFQKPSEVGAPFPMHQDWSYFPTMKDTMMAAVIHVSAANEEMGCLRVYPGSHRLGRLTDSDGQLEESMLLDYPIQDATPLEAEPGDVVFFHYLTIHGSMPNRSDRARKTVLVQLHAGDDDVEPGNQHPNERLALRGWNHRMTRSMANH